MVRLVYPLVVSRMTCRVTNLSGVYDAALLRTKAVSPTEQKERILLVYQPVS